MNQNFFSFFEIPEVIVKKSYSRKDYDEIILKFLMKVSKYNFGNFRACNSEG